MVTNLARIVLGITLGLMLFNGTGLAADPAELEKFVKARIEIGEMMTSYFKGGGERQPSTPQQRSEMGADINAKLSKLLAKHDLTIEEYRKRSKEVFADEAAVKHYLNEHPDLKARYEALPLDRMGRGGSSGRGY